MKDATGLVLVSVIDGRRLDTFLLDGKPIWPCAQVGDLLGYVNRGRRLGTRITSEWQKEFVEGEHYVVPEGQVLADLLGGKGAEPAVAGRSTSPTFLTSAGFRQVLAKTPGVTSDSLLVILDKELLPRVARHPLVAPRRDGDEIAVVVLLTPAQREPRERHPLDELVERAFESGLVRAAVRALFGLAPEPGPRTDAGCWHSLAEIAGFAEASEDAVAMAIRELGIRGAPAFSRATVGTARDGSPVLAFVYNHLAIRMILAALGEELPDEAA
ncbi:MAG: hypothetical protein Q8P41_13220 [Pseudomonadota bacterium]|nr:hypothetical protein [Pseudomonadota bacterium]